MKAEEKKGEGPNYVWMDERVRGYLSREHAFFPSFVMVESNSLEFTANGVLEPV